MLTANKLEKIMELEETLRAEYQAQLDAKAADIEARNADLEAAKEQQNKMQATIDQQLAKIKELSESASANQRVEQLNRELSNRAEKLTDELAELKKRVKTMQKDLAEERTENKALKQFDPARMKKNLDATKKKLAEKTRISDNLQKSLNQAKAENSTQQRKIEELESKLAELESADTATEEEAA